MAAKLWLVPCQQNTGHRSVKRKQTGCWSEIWQHTQPLRNRWTIDQLHMIVNNWLLLRNVTGKHCRPEPAGNEELASLPAFCFLYPAFPHSKTMSMLLQCAVWEHSTSWHGVHRVFFEKQGLSRASIVTFKDLRNFKKKKKKKGAKKICFYRNKTLQE